MPQITYVHPNGTRQTLDVPCGTSVLRGAILNCLEGIVGRIVVIGDEPVPPYQRPPLSKSYLAGDSGLDELWLRPESFYTQHQIDVRAGERVTAIDRRGRRLRLAAGGTVQWDHLVL